MPDTAAFQPGDRVLLRDQPLSSPLIVDHVRMFFDDSVWCRSEDEPGGRPRRYDQRELVPCPPEYEPLPAAHDHWLALRWLTRNRALLVATVGEEVVEIAVRHVRERIVLHERIATALSAEPEASAIRRAEIALAEAGR